MTCEHHYVNALKNRTYTGLRVICVKCGEIRTDTLPRPS